LFVIELISKFNINPEVTATYKGDDVVLAEANTKTPL
jgi:hypothetical protein